MAADSRSALVLFSGGQDSTVCLAHALERYAHVETIGFDYGQRHLVELESRLHVRAQLLENLAIGGALRAALFQQYDKARKEHAAAPQPDDAVTKVDSQE